MAKTVKKAIKKVVEPVITPAEFNKLPKATQRIMIAEDVIKQVRARRYRPKESVYVDMNMPGGVQWKDDARTHIDKVRNCQVCALGACLVSAVRFKNTLTMDQMINPLNHKPKTGKLLQSLFTPNQWAAIESAFEGRYHHSGYWSTGNKDEGAMGGRLTAEMANKVEEFAYKYKTETERLIAIMQNIIANKGTFKP